MLVDYSDLLEWQEPYKSILLLMVERQVFISLIWAKWRWKKKWASIPYFPEYKELSMREIVMLTFVDMLLNAFFTVFWLKSSISMYCFKQIKAPYMIKKFLRAWKKRIVLSVFNKSDPTSCSGKDVFAIDILSVTSI